VTSPLPNRRHAVTEKIGREETGLAGALFAHVEHDDVGRIISVRFSHKWRDGGSLDQALAALGDAVTSIAREIQQGEAA
jgi:hypothetical protein